MAETDETRAFRMAYAQLNGNPEFAPYPWQERLFLEMSAGRFPAGLDIPTGLGKTSVIEIWLLAHLLGKAKPPMRLVYVVNRRTIVDQATTIAEDLKRTTKELAEWKSCLGESGLAVSALRGALADNREWMQRPHRPAIIIGTVDMIGSRLLFDAYRAGKWTKAMHAGLLGQDSLIVHDEAHLSLPFQKLLEWIGNKQKSDHSPRPICVMAMSATGSTNDAEVKEPPLGLDENDRAIKAVQERIHAVKRLRIQACEKSKLADTLSNMAAAYEGEGDAAKRVIVYVTTPEVAKKVFDFLSKKLKEAKDRIELLTGTIRGYERDALVAQHTLHHLLHSDPKPPKSVYLISTSAGEVGADFDADHLICDIAPLDSMIQRLGRVNRRGKGDAKIDVLVDVKEGGKISDIDQRRLNSRDWLGKLPPIDGDADGRLNASPYALKNLRESDDTGYGTAISETPSPVEPHDVTLDAWAMTSIQDAWSLSHPLDEYLHGVGKYEPPRTSIAWRDEMSIFFPHHAEPEPSSYDYSERKLQFAAWIESYPLHLRELVSNKSENVMDLLAVIGTKHPDTFFARLHRREICIERLGTYVAKYLDRDKTGQQRFWGEIADQTFILPSGMGGLNKAGIIDAEVSSQILDVADGDKDAIQDRSRAWLATDEDGDFASPHWLGKPRKIEPVSTRSSWIEWRDEIRPNEMKEGRKFRFGIKLTRMDKLAGVLLFFKRPSEAYQGDEKIGLLDHRQKTKEFAESFAEIIGEDVDARALRLAALWHDLGKDRAQWQLSIGNAAGNPPLAKSFGGKGMKATELNGYRHEFGSLIDIVQNEKEFKDIGADLLLHLVATHHGRGRPLFPQGDFDPDNLARKEFGDLLTPAAIAKRYAYLQRKYGHWGLAWLESLLMCADQAASRGDEPEDIS